MKKKYYIIAKGGRGITDIAPTFFGNIRNCVLRVRTKFKQFTLRNNEVIDFWPDSTTVHWMRLQTRSHMILILYILSLVKHQKSLKNCKNIPFLKTV